MYDLRTISATRGSYEWTRGYWCHPSEGGGMACLLFFLSLVLVLPDSSNRGLLFHVLVKVQVNYTAWLIWSYSFLIWPCNFLIWSCSFLIWSYSFLIWLCSFLLWSYRFLPWSYSFLIWLYSFLMMAVSGLHWTGMVHCRRLNHTWRSVSGVWWNQELRWVVTSCWSETCWHTSSW